MITVRAPGKLFIAGEYAVVEPGQPAVIIAIDRYLAVTLTESVDVGTVHSPEYGQLPLVWRRSGDDVTIDRDHHPYDYVMSAITTVERVRARRGVAPKFFDTRIDSQLDDVSGRKFGIGSSAAVTVATVRAMSELYGLGLSNLEVFKLALLATVQIAPAASGGDLAASCFGGWIRYSAPDRARLIAETRDAMWRERSVQRVVDVQRRADIALFSVGALQGELPSHVYSAGYLEPDDVATLEAEGVVGDVCTVFLRADGTYSDIDLNARATGPTPAQLRAVPRRVCAVAGDNKVVPLRAALLAGAVTHLVIDELTALRLFELDDAERAAAERGAALRDATTAS